MQLRTPIEVTVTAYPSTCARCGHGPDMHKIDAYMLIDTDTQQITTVVDIGYCFARDEWYRMCSCFHFEERG